LTTLKLENIRLSEQINLLRQKNVPSTPIRTVPKVAGLVTPLQTAQKNKNIASTNKIESNKKRRTEGEFSNEMKTVSVKPGDERKFVIDELDLADFQRDPIKL